MVRNFGSRKTPVFLQFSLLSHKDECKSTTANIDSHRMGVGNPCIDPPFHPSRTITNQRQGSGGIETIHTLKSYRYSRCGDTIRGSTASGALCADVRARDKGKRRQTRHLLENREKNFFFVSRRKSEKKKRGGRAGEKEA